MKKKLLAAFLCMVVLCASGCSSGKNTLAPLTLSNEQQSIVRLLNPFDDIYTYTYTMREDYASMSVWLERYEHGILSEKMAEVIVRREESDPKEGQIALVTRYTPELQWVISVADKSNTSSLRSPMLPETDHYSMQVPIPGETKFTLDEEVTILFLLYSEESSPPTYAVLDGAEDLLKQYPSAFLLKCSFKAPEVQEEAS